MLTQSYANIKGKINLDVLTVIYMTIVLFSPTYTYYMAVSKKQQPPFPHATVTNTACHYPQDILFRWTMGFAQGFLMLIFHIIFRFVQCQAKKYNYEGSTYSYMYWPTMVSIVGYMTAIGTIDGDGTGLAHSVGAVYFFVVLYFNVVNLTIVCHKIYKWDSSSFSRSSISRKIVVSSYLSFIWLYCLVGLLMEPFGTTNSDDKYIVIVEWNLTYAGLVWILCFYTDFKHISLCLSNTKARLTAPQ